jgi:hypothetical protein
LLTATLSSPGERQLKLTACVARPGQPVQLPDEGHRRPLYRAQSVAKYMVELPEKYILSEART